MADVKARLKAEGWSDEDIATFIKDEKALKVIEKMTAKEEDSEKFYQDTLKYKKELEDWNNTKIQPYVAKKDQEVAQVRGELAKVSTYLQSLKAAGYDVSDELITAGGTPPPRVEPTVDGSKYVAKEDFDKQGKDWVMTQLDLQELSETHRDLTGKGLKTRSEYDDFVKNGRPNETLRTYVARKYDHETLSRERSTKEKNEYEERLRAEGRAAAAAEYQTKYGSNPETRVAVASRYDAFKTDESKKNAWNTREGRDAAAKDRLAKFASAKFIQ